MPQQTEPALELEVDIDATPEVVFSFLVDPERIVRWMGSAATLDPRPGGAYRIRINELAAAEGEFVEVDPPRRVVFSFGPAAIRTA